MENRVSLKYFVNGCSIAFKKNETLAFITKLYIKLPKAFHLQTTQGINKITFLQNEIQNTVLIK